jgi:hypothetical protein
LRRGPHVNCIIIQLKKSQDLAGNLLIELKGSGFDLHANTRYLLTTKSSGEIQLSPKATPEN